MNFVFALSLALFVGRAHAVNHGVPTVAWRNSVARLQILARDGQALGQFSAAVVAADKIATAHHCLTTKVKGAVGLRVTVNGVPYEFAMPRTTGTFCDRAVVLKMPVPIASFRPLMVPENSNEWRKHRNRMDTITIVGFGGQDWLTLAEAERLVPLAHDDSAGREFLEAYVAVLNKHNDWTYARYLRTRDALPRRQSFSRLADLQGRRVAHEVTRDPRWVDDRTFEIRPRKTIYEGDSGGAVIVNTRDGGHWLLGLISAGKIGWLWFPDEIDFVKTRTAEMPVVDLLPCANSLSE